ncbi:MAG TPA: hypothetical protein VNI83_05885 [Vicinamibacterales bacterium]|nr:hypothetical protein [Vicinamibacterales bacterium]
MTSSRLATLALTAAVLAAAPEALAQPRPYRPLFGGAAPAAPGRQALDLTLTLAGGYDDDVLHDAGDLRLDPRLLGGVFTALSGDLRYALRARRVEFAASAGSSLRRFHDMGATVPVGHYAGVGLSLTPGSRTTIVLTQSVSHTPSPLYGLFARAAAAALAELAPTGVDYAYGDVRTYTYVAALRATRQVGRRGTLSFDSGYRRTDVDGEVVGFSDLVAYDVGGAYSHGLGRDVSLRLGYTYREGQYFDTVRARQHDLDAGIDYNRPLSRSRRTRLALGFGSTVIEGPPFGSPSAVVVRQYRARAHAGLTHHMGRTWTLGAVYRRGGHLVEGIPAPFYTDSVTVTLGGFLTRRADLTASAAYTAGDVWGQSATAIETYTGDLRLRVGLTRTLAAFAEYLYYYYDFARAPELQGALPPRLRRQGVRVGLAVWLPVLQR